MNYYIDTEFIEGFHKPPFGKKRHFIDLISIGIVAEDGREYYAISNEFNPKNADEWVRNNVLEPICKEYNAYIPPHNIDKDIRNVQREYGKSNKQITREIIEFCKSGTFIRYRGLHGEPTKFKEEVRTEPEFYGYYADYDWVLFCSLFGRMIDLPKGFPMYCRDLKQTFDEKNAKSKLVLEFATLDSIKELDGYPKQTDEHNALADAKWNMELHKFLKAL